jgi:hypothetical protein
MKQSKKSQQKNGIQDQITQPIEVSLFLSIVSIDLVLDQQSMGKRSLHLMHTVNAKKRWRIYWRVNN